MATTQPRMTAKRYILLHVLLSSPELKTPLEIGRSALTYLDRADNNRGKPRAAWSIRDWSGDGLRDLLNLGWVFRAPCKPAGFAYTITPQGQEVHTKVQASGKASELEAQARVLLDSAY